MKKPEHYLLALFLAAASLLSVAADSAKPATPFVNPYLAASTNPVVHMSWDLTPTAGPIGPSRRLRPDEIQWKPVGPINSFSPMYSGPYPNGKRVVWVGGYDRVEKLDADTLEVLSTYAIGGNTYFGEEEIKRHIAAMDRLDDKAFVGYNLKLWPELLGYLGSVYHLISRDNELYIPYRGADGTRSLRLFGDADPVDPASKIVLRREWIIPPELSKAALFGMNMTSDCWIVMVTADGVLFTIARDFSKYYSIKLPSLHEEGPNQDVFASFVRNGISTDDHGGIYVVTRDHMHRVQWTGSKLSLDEADGAWSAPYPNELGIGSGTTPSLMGWGSQEDHLVMIADAARSNNAIAFWRDKIPDDWKGLPGFDRRVAAITPVRFGVSKNEQAQIENAPIIYGQGAFFNNTFPVKRIPVQGGPMKQWLTDVLLMNVPGHEAPGGAMIRWDQQTRTLKTVWQTQTNFASSLCTISSATEIVYCWGARHREWTLEGTDWHTGKSAFHYTLGKSVRFHPLAGPVYIAPNGAVDCGCTGSLGIVRVKPKEMRAVRK